MPMDGDDLGTAINAALVTAGIALAGGNEAAWQAIGGAIVSYLSANASITISPTDTGLQEIPASPTPIPCLGPTVAKTITGALS